MTAPYPSPPAPADPNAADAHAHHHHLHVELKPLLRGVFHQWGALVAGAAGLVLIVIAPPGSRLAATVYAVCLTTMLATSALFHRVSWSPAANARMRRADHTGIFLAIAGTYTPIVGVGLTGWLRPTLLVAVWAVAAVGIVVEWLPFDPPRGYVTAIYLAAGWICLLAIPAMWSQLGAGVFFWVGLGGILYTIGAFVHAFRWPDPSPRVFGFHEIWHLFVLAAAASQYVAVFLVLRAA